jgi:integrase
VQDAVDDYLLFLGDRGSLIKFRIAKHISPKLGGELVQELTSDTIRRWHNGMVRAGAGDEAERKSKVSANRMLAVLKSALNLAFKEGKVANDSAWRRVSLFKNVVRARTRYLSLAECERLINASTPDFRPLVRGALETGARYGELCRMVCGDFNPDAGTVHVLKSKSGRERHIILTEEGAAFFREITAGCPKDAFIFMRACGDPWGPDHQKACMIATCLAGRIQPGINFHGLRHTWASHAVMAGMPLGVVARNLGHTDEKMVQKHYAHLCPDYISDQVRKFAPRFGKVAGNVRAVR